MKSRLALTVVTVAKADTERLSRTAQSLFMQTSTNFEWVIIDGGGNDFNSPHMREALGKMSVQIHQQPPQGIYSAMNRGLQLARGEYVIFLNAGDRFKNDSTVADILGIFEEFPGTDVFASVVEHLFNQKILLDITYPQLKKSANFNYLLANHQGVLIRNSLAMKVGGFDESMKFASDGKFLDAAVAAGQVTLIPYAIVNVEIGGVASQNIRTTLQEMNTYRRNFISPLQIEVNFYKNFLKMTILNSRSILITLILRPIFLNYKKRKILSYVHKAD